MGMRSRAPIWISFALFVVGVFSGCARREVLQLHYLNGFVPGTRAIFAPVKVAIPPIAGELAVGNHDVGGVYNPTGERTKILSVSNAGATIHAALISGLADSGLKPIALDTDLDPKNLPPGIDLSLSCELEQLQVLKRFGNAHSVHGQYFTMISRVGLKFTLRNRNGVKPLYENEQLGREEEPPKPVGGEIFFPLETEPAESLSVAMSRAIGTLLANPDFRKVLPMRSSP
jgi:hypothetical protein